MYELRPLDSAMMSAMPMMPMDPAKEVRMVLALFVPRLLSDRDRAVSGDMRVFFIFTPLSSLPPALSGSNGSLSPVIMPSLRVMIRVEYFSASSGLWVTMMTRRSEAISFSISMTAMPVAESRAPVGSSASRMSGSLTSARAMATRCIWPPESWFGRLPT